jgi:cytochrome c oxidase assembly protein subunit 15
MRRFHKLCITTLISVYILIAVGSIVRVTGSGMGCPDWPRCFGNFIPPTRIEQLPSDYKEKYASIREKKNIKFAKYLSAIGLDDTAREILQDRTILQEEDFNPVKTWIEYINRLVGVVIGFLILLLAYRSIRIRHSDPVVFYMSVATLLLVIFQGWFGSIVVSTNLTTWTITIHMFLALVIVVMLVFLQNRSAERTPAISPERGNILMTLAAMMMLFVQVYMGTEVRAVVDILADMLPRAQWMSQLGVSAEFLTHRAFSWMVVLIHVILVVKIRKTGRSNSLTTALIILILGTLSTGVGMAWLGVPAVLQPLHLTLATMAIGTEALLLFRLTSAKKKLAQAA